MRPDVALVAPYPPRGARHAGSSGVASYAANLAQALASQGASVCVIAQALPGEPPLSADGAVAVRRHWRRGALALPAAARAAAATGAPVVHIQHETFLYGGALAAPGIGPALGLLRRRAATVVTMHHVVAPREVDASFVALHGVRAPAAVARAGLAGIQGTIAALADRVIVHEPAFARLVPGAAVIPHGIEPGRPSGAAGASHGIEPAPPSGAAGPPHGIEQPAPAPAREVARRALGLDDRLVVLCFGHVAPYKGLEGALAAAAAAGDRVALVVAGGAHPRMEGYARGLARHWAGTARFAGYVPERDVAGWFVAADVALFNYPTAFASSGALALALAYGTPVLLSPALAACYDAPSALVAPRAPEALGRRLAALAADRRALAPLAEQAGALARDRAWPAVARRHLELYEEVNRADRDAGRRLRAA